MDGQEVITSGNDIVDINTGKIKIENVTGDIDIKVATKKLEIKYTTIAVSKSNSASNAGDWTEEKINELKEKNLYMINKEKICNNTFNLDDVNSGLNLTFGGFTYKEDTENASDITSGNIITSRNQSITPESGFGVGTPKYSGWQILESKEENGKTYVTKMACVCRYELLQLQGVVCEQQR